MARFKSEPLRITMSKDLALRARDVLAAQGVPLTVTQAVSAMLQFAIDTKTKSPAALSANTATKEPVHYESEQSNHNG